MVQCFALVLTVSWSPACPMVASILHLWRRYRGECTGPLPTSKVKRRRSRLVLGWGAAREDLRVLPALHAHQSARTKAIPANCADAISIGTRWRPYRVECTGSLPTSEVKRRRARLVLGWGTAREDFRVLPALHAHQSSRTKAIPANCADAISIGTRWRPYRAECTGSLPTSEVKRRTARLVLGWGTAREDLRVLSAFSFHGCDG